MKITVNGQGRAVDASPDTPLLWVLRDHLQLTGTKYGCGLAQCGACTVHLGGQAVRSCSVPVSAVGNQPVTTIEGLSPRGDHPLQRSWVKLDVPQCGYCQSGMIMNAAALLRRKPKPTDRDIDEAMGGLICRCGTYNRIRAAIHDAAGQRDPAARFMAWADEEPVGAMATATAAAGVDTAAAAACAHSGGHAGCSTHLAAASAAERATRRPTKVTSAFTNAAATDVDTGHATVPTTEPATGSAA